MTNKPEPPRETAECPRCHSREKTHYSVGCSSIYVTCHPWHGPDPLADAPAPTPEPHADDGHDCDFCKEMQARTPETPKLYGTPDNAVWSKQQWIDNATYWNKAWKEAVEYRDMNYESVKRLEKELSAAEAELARCKEALQEIADLPLGDHRAKKIAMSATISLDIS